MTALLNAALTAAAVLALMPTQPTPTIAPPCGSELCKPGGAIAAAQRIIDAQLADLTKGRDCWTPDTRPDTIPATVLVKGAEQQRSVVWEITLDEAFKINGDGDSWDDVIVVRGCAG